MINRAQEESSVVRLVDDLIISAIKRSASDIHIETGQDVLRVRYRIDGVLYDQPALALSQAPQVLSRLKILSHLNIAEKRIPQDGKFRVNHNNAIIDLRVSSFPSIYGEKIVIRILDQSHMMIALDTLGMRNAMFQQFND